MTSSSNSRRMLLAALVCAVLAGATVFVLRVPRSRSESPTRRATSENRAANQAGASQGNHAASTRSGRPNPLPLLGNPGATTDHATDSAETPRKSVAVTPTVTARGFEVVDVASDLIDECYELARQRNPELRGTLRVDVTLATDPELGNLLASAEIDDEHTTVEDEQLIACATENVFAAEEILEQLRQEGDETGGDMVFRINKLFPPPPEQEPDWPADDSSPNCPAGTRLAGAGPPHGASQWCELPDGRKHGERFYWEDGVVWTIMLYDHGTSTKALMRPRGR